MRRLSRNTHTKQMICSTRCLYVYLFVYLFVYTQNTYLPFECCTHGGNTNGRYMCGCHHIYTRNICVMCIHTQKMCGYRCDVFQGIHTQQR